MSGGEVTIRRLGLIVILLLAACIVAIAGEERITPVDALPLLQHTFQFTVTTKDEYTDVHFVIERSASGAGKETLLPPMIGKCSLMRGRNLVVVTILPGKSETLFQLAVNGNGCGHRLIDQYPDDETARAGAGRKYTFLTKAGWSKERRGLILTEGPDKDPERIRCVLTFFHPDHEHDDNPGHVFGQIEGVDNF